MKKKTVEDKLLSAAAEFLEQNRWKALVIGGITVEHRTQDPKLNYRLVVNFTGGKVEVQSDKKELEL